MQMWIEPISTPLFMCLSVGEFSILCSDLLSGPDSKIFFIFAGLWIRIQEGKIFKYKQKCKKIVKTSKFFQIFKSKFAQDSLFLTFLTIFNVFYN